MLNRSSLWLILCHVALGVPAMVRAEGTGADRNVIVVTLDGFRHQEFFGGIQEDLINPKAGGVPDGKELLSDLGGPTPQIRREKLMPFVWGTIAAKGQILGDRSRGAPATLTNGLKFSYPGYSEIFCGFGDPRIDSNKKFPNPNLSVLEFLDERPAFRGKVAALTTWDVFPSIFRTSQNRLFVQAGWDPIRGDSLTERQVQINRTISRLPRYWHDNVYDAVVMDAAVEHVRLHKPRVLYLALGETDEWAHGRKYELYARAAHRADAFLAEFWAALQSMPEYRGKTSLILTTDHGRGAGPEDWTSHGQKIVGAEFIWIAALGPDIPAKGVREGVVVTQSQIAATIAALVGEDFRAASPRSAALLPILAP